MYINYYHWHSSRKNPHIQEIGSWLPSCTWAACGVASGNPAARGGRPHGHPSFPWRMGTSVGLASQDYSFTHFLLCICWVLTNKSTFSISVFRLWFVFLIWTLAFLIYKFLYTVHLVNQPSLGFMCSWTLRGKFHLLQSKTHLKCQAWGTICYSLNMSWFPWRQCLVPGP